MNFVENKHKNMLILTTLYFLPNLSWHVGRFLLVFLFFIFFFLSICTAAGRWCVHISVQDVAGASSKPGSVYKVSMSVSQWWSGMKVGWVLHRRSRCLFLGSITLSPLSHLFWLAPHCSIAHFTQRLSLWNPSEVTTGAPYFFYFCPFLKLDFFFFFVSLAFPQHFGRHAEDTGAAVAVMW